MRATEMGKPARVVVEGVTPVKKKVQGNWITKPPSSLSD
jgi:hypothetical protein